MNEVAQEVIVQVVSLVGGVLTIVVPILVFQVLAVAKRRWNLELSQRQETAIERAIEDAITATESRALAAVKRGDAAPTGAAKALEAIALARALAVEHGIEKLPDEVLAAKVESRFSTLKAIGDLPGSAQE